jgi:pSer/pThr/pTyr-binding forkhead associated (FHA) protein
LEVVFVHISKNGSTSAVPLPRERTFVGRLDDCHIRVPAAGISRKHCEIVISDGSITVNDLGSSNGTYVNQERIDSQPVAAGDLVSFGGLVFLVTVNGEPGDIDAEIMYQDGLPEKSVAPAPVAAQVQSAPAPKTMVPADDVNEDSSMMDFDFDFDDDDEQPPL